MADFQTLVVTPGPAATQTVPTYTIEALVTDSNSGEVLSDLTGPNAIQFPAVLSTFTPEQRDAFIDRVYNWLILTKAGLL